MVLAVLEPRSCNVTLFRRSSTWTYFQSGVGRTMPSGTAGGNSNCSSAWSSSSAGSGQDKPAATARMTWSDTVVTGMPSEALTWRRLSSSPKLGRRTSRTCAWRHGVWATATPRTGLSEEPAEQGLLAPAARRVSSAGVRKRRNRCTDSIGTGVRNGSEFARQMRLPSHAPTDHGTGSLNTLGRGRFRPEGGILQGCLTRTRCAPRGAMFESSGDERAPLPVCRSSPVKLRAA